MQQVGAGYKDNLCKQPKENKIRSVCSLFLASLFAHIKYREKSMILIKISSIQEITVICIPIVFLRRLFRMDSLDSEEIIVSLLPDLEVNTKY